MHLESKTELHDETIGKLQQVIQANFDCGLALDESAGVISDPVLAVALSKLSVNHTAFAEELGAWVKANDEQPKLIGSWQGVWQRIYADFRASVQSGDLQTVLSDVAKREVQLKDLYEEVLLETVGSAMNDVLQHQLAELSAVVRDIQALLDHLKTQAC